VMGSGFAVAGRPLSRAAGVAPTTGREAVVNIRGRSVSIENTRTGTLRTVGAEDVFSVAELAEFAQEAAQAGAREVVIRNDGAGYSLRFETRADV
jgi:hypothetical protein